MPYLPVVTASGEGGFYRPGRAIAPIRIFHDRWVEDDIVKARGGSLRRERLTRKEFRRIKRAARANKAAGRV